MGDVRTRVRQRIRRLLDDRGLKQKAFAARIGHSEQWASNLLRGDFTLTMDDLDKVADALKVPPSEIVRLHDDPWELTPTEMRAIRALRMLPVAIRDHAVTTLDYTVGVWPEEADLLVEIRALGEEGVDLHVVREYLRLKRLEAAHAQAKARRDAHQERAEPRALRSVRIRGGRKRSTV